MDVTTGERVRWTSQPSHQGEKEGVVVAVVPPNKRPAVYRDVEKTKENLRELGLNPERYVLEKLGGGTSREKESYVVAVSPDSDHPRAKPRLYWPFVEDLEIVEEDERKTKQTSEG